MYGNNDGKLAIGAGMRGDFSDMLIEEGLINTPEEIQKFFPATIKVFVSEVIEFLTDQFRVEDITVITHNNNEVESLRELLKKKRNSAN